MAANLGVTDHLADVFAIFDDRVAGLQRLDRDLVADGDIGLGGQAEIRIVSCDDAQHLGARAEVFDDDDADVILVIVDQKLRNAQRILPFSDGMNSLRQVLTYILTLIQDYLYIYCQFMICRDNQGKIQGFTPTMGQPLYQKVIDTIVARIGSGELLPGGMLPSEMQLAAEIGVSQGTARKALMMLEQHGIVRREQGRGSFVTARTPESSLFNFFRLRENDGTIIRPELIDEQITQRDATPIERDTLFDKPEQVYEIRRIRSLKGVASTIESAVLPAPIFAGIDRRAPLPSALYILYQQNYGCIVLRADESINAVAADADEARALNVEPGAPLLRVERLAHDILGRPIERRRSVYRTDQLSYKVTLD
ncbi:GntR family transcriptional regulator [Paracoccus sp. Z330]|uniref:GntR family transcriptional regulator n=1 Tax=Paracoccus onchidii TaxID=3017813 RepID=A0ABT4ZDI0_9RHOB|nr:GntR family transcriptional regulator [Paracoccus onchidii]MDB6177419.1 GntR family transcriptional regulator [Paracoccus onchidii]